MISSRRILPSVQCLMAIWILNGWAISPEFEEALVGRFAEPLVLGADSKLQIEMKHLQGC